MVTLPIYTLLFLALFGDLLFTFTMPKYFAVLNEFLIIALLIIALLSIQMNRRGFVLHLWYSFFFMVVISACSIIVNGSNILRAAYSIRLLYRFYFFYLGIITLNLDDNIMKKINMFVAVLLLMQLPVVAVKFPIYGISEKTTGAYGGGGSLTAMLPIAVIFYLAAYYFLYRPKMRYVLLGIGFVLLSIVGKKRAVAFLYPLQFLAIYYYIYIKGKGAHFSKKMGTLFIVLTSIAVVSGSIFYFNESLNPEGQVGGSVDVGYALGYAKNYTSGVDGYGYSYGRVATTIRVVEALWNSGFAGFFFGFGPGSTTPSLFDSPEERKSVQKLFDRFMIGYGLTPINRIAFEYGVFGVVAFSLIVFLFARMCWRYYKIEVDPYWKAFAAGSVGFAFSMLFFYFAYHHPAFWGDALPALYFYAMAVVYTRSKKIIRPVAGIEPIT